MSLKAVNFNKLYSLFIQKIHGNYGTYVQIYENEFMMSYDKRFIDL